MPPDLIASPPHPMTASASPLPPIAFIGGGNMASAIIGGLLQRGLPAGQIEVVEPFEPARAALREKFGITAQPAAGDALARAALVVWAVKPQTFKEAAAATRAHTATALHLSVAAGIPTDSIARWLDTQHIVRAMPNTPALVGKGITGLFARPQVDPQGKALVERVIATTGQFVWVEAEEQLDA
ncbi:NAD(P)-binding domain-containing protein, partial [Diaphorobacter nitroreducens]|uniref:NAD(P)-binding domain-containing protein n=1 Tax=Diaphorobacter nitroreducens TaxID=164759 RepID=UPI003D6ACD50